MDMVFPASMEERCPRVGCGSRNVEPLETEMDFAGPMIGMLWLCADCARPFKLVRAAELTGATR